MAKLKKIIKENFSLVGGVVSVPAVNAGYGSLSQIVKEKYGEQTQRVSSEQVSKALKSYNKLGETLYQQQSLKKTAKSLSEIAEMAATHTVQETEDWFDKVTVTTNHSKQFSKIAEEASSVQQRLSALYEDMGVILNRYYDIPETHIVGHDDDDRDIQSSDTIEEGDYEQFFQSAMKKFGIKSPDELGSDEKKKKFFNYVDKNYKAKAEGKIKEGGKGSGRKAKPGSAKDIDNRMSAAVADANARLDAAEQDSEEAQQPGKRDDDKDIKYY